MKAEQKILIAGAVLIVIGAVIGDTTSLTATPIAIASIGALCIMLGPLAIAAGDNE